MRRSDTCPGPHPGHDGEPPAAWHMDQAFLPEHYAATPRQMYYHTMLALSPVITGGAPFFAANGAFSTAKRLTQAMTEAERQRWAPHADATRLDLPRFLRPHIELSQYTEVNLSVGDLLVLDPMCMHSASPNAGALPARHVLFTTMFAPDASGVTLSGLPGRMAVAPATKFSEELREGLPPALRGLLDWELPPAVQEQEQQQEPRQKL